MRRRMLVAVLGAPVRDWVGAAGKIKFRRIINRLANQIALHRRQLLDHLARLLPIVSRVNPVIAIANHHCFADTIGQVGGAGVPGSVFEEDAIARVQQGFDLGRRVDFAPPGNSIRSVS